jgi:chromosome segregation ATPase
MRFTIRTDCLRGLRVIDEIPDIGLCRIEGHNGIGKSTAIRLLQLCAGAQPYEREEMAWLTLREQLVSATVRVTELDGARSLEWRVDPARWPTRPEPLGDDVGSVEIDGVPARAEDVQQILQVHRLVGHETLTDTLAQRVQDAAVTVRRWISQTGPGWRRRERLDHMLADVQDHVNSYDVASFHADRRRLDEAATRLTDHSTRLQATGERVEVLSEALRLFDQLEEVRGQGPGLDEELDDLESELSSLGEQRERLDAEIEDVAVREQRDEQARTKFSQAQRLVDRRRSELHNATDAFVQAARDAAMSADTDEAARALQTAQQRLADLTAELPKVNAAPLLAELLRSLAGRLRDAEDAGLADQQVIPGDTGHGSWTVEALRQTFEAEADKRAAEQPSATAEEVEAEISKARGRVAVLVDITAKREAIAEAEQRLTTAERRLNSAAAALPAGTAKALQSLLSRRTTLDGRIRELDSRKEQIRQARDLLGGGLTEQVLNQQLTAACRSVDVEPARIRGELGAAQAQLQRLQTATAAIRAEREAYQKAVDGRVRQAANAYTSLRAVTWLAPHLEAITMGKADLDSQIIAVSCLANALDKTRERLDRFTTDVQAMVDALDRLSDQFRGHASQIGEWATEVNSWLTAEVHQWFDHEEVRQALFGGGRDIQLDLETMQVSWTLHGQRQTRPLQAFSSGEQALAYTRARLALLDRQASRAENRLLALDEFGAFIAADRMRNLINYLHDRRRSYPRDQILVVLPLTADLRSAPSAGDDNLMALRREQLRRRGYFAESLADD